METAPEASRQLLEGAKRKNGFIPNLLGVLAEAPAALEAYTSVSDLLAKSSLTATERETVLIAASIRNGCDYCVAAHSTIARMQKVPEEVIEALREERPISDPRLEALRRFTETLVEKRGWASEQEVRTFLETGFRRSQVLEVVLGVTLKTLSNYTNNLVDTPLDKAFAGTQRVRKAG
jgi:uncharacterized peroxidase-related enzyme